MSVLREPNAEPIPGYRLIEPLGSGGFGEAWKCEAPGGLFKAIKFVFGNLNSLDVDGARAEQELRALNRVKEVRHPFVLSMDRIEVVEGELVIVMELADRSLHDLFQECISAGLVGIPRDALLRYVRDAAEALDHMNEKHNLQHLDIKPRNLFLISDRVKVADFGLVKHLERSGASGILGGVTPLYAPPETFSGSISGRSDQYSLAIVYQELLTGQRPFNGKNARTLAQQHMNEEPELRALPEGERPIVARALAKDPAKRFPNCLAFVRALYTARSLSRPETLHSDSPALEGMRPKSIADTMENMLLEQLPGENGPLPGDVLVEIPSDGDDVSRLGMTIAQPQTGALRPTVVIGVGSFGRRALQELRCRFLDRFGDLDKVPLVRFLYLDSDGDAVKAATRGAPEVALSSNEVQHLPLQPVSHYRRRQLDQLSEWLPREKLFSLPRSLKTQGSRALGRLAFTDNYLRLIARIRREIQTACHPDSIYQTVSQTGLALRDNVPRIYVIACASGGGSGFVIDLGYSLRRLLNQLHQPEGLVTSFLFCGAPDDPATPPTELANLYATLTEVYHFSDPAVPFTAQYGSDGPRLIDEGAAFDSTYLMTLTHRTPEARRDAMAHLSSYLFHELTTPLGARLERTRLSRGVLPFRSFGTYGVWFPRGLLLHLAARGACQRLLEQWQAATLDEYTVISDKHASLLADSSALGVLDDQPRITAHDLLEAAQARVLADPELHADALANRILELAGQQLESSPRELLTRLLSAIEEQSQQMVALDDPGAWARQALTRVQDWLGGGLQPPGTTTLGPQRKSRLTRALEHAAAKLAESWDKRFAAAATGLMEHPGRRIALAEAALNRFLHYCREATEAQQQRLQQQAGKSEQSQKQLQTALDNCIEGTGGFSWFGGKSRRLLRVFVDHLAAFARQCLAEDTLSAVQQFYSFLQGRFADRLRDLTFCRQRLRHMQEALAETAGNTATGSLHIPLDEWTGAAALNGGLEYSPTPVLSTESFWDSIRESTTARVVLPDGAKDLEEAARRFLETLTAEQWTQLDQVLQDQVLAGRDGLQKALLSTTDLVRHLMTPLITHTVSCLGNHLPITDVAQVEFSVEGQADSCGLSAADLAVRIQKYYKRAVPALRHTPRKRRSGIHQVAAVGGPALDDTPIAGTGVSPAPGDAEPSGKEHGFLLVPASDAGKRYGEKAQQNLADLQLVNVPGQADLMFCREQEELSLEDLERMLRSSRPAYEEAVNVPQSSPHARFDIQDWMPLDL
ncbi:MAG TPA: tubulin-like doman-containing protein [Gemmataceae bacterium]|nr:tubulin-like doman-containing protein [Gemmataceae bacterium]